MTVTGREDDVVMLEVDVEDEVTGTSIENALYDTRIMTTMAATIIAVVFLVIATLKRPAGAIR